MVIELAYKQVELFHKDNVVYISTLVKCSSIQSIWINAYTCLCNTYKILPLERLFLEERTRLWEDTKSLINDVAKDYPLSKEEKVKIAKSLYTLEHLLNHEGRTFDNTGTGN